MSEIKNVVDNVHRLAATSEPRELWIRAYEKIGFESAKHRQLALRSQKTRVDYFKLDFGFVAKSPRDEFR